jgi:nicotinate-nucleotide adenylyltransferase
MHKRRRVTVKRQPNYAGKRIGIYSGTFDPVHAGHIAFALQAAQTVKLDKVYFMPERRPRYKHGVEHFGHRVAMLRRATKPYRQFDVMETVDISFSVERTLPKLREQFKGAQLVFLAGSDAALQIPTWPLSERLLETSELVIGLRQADSGARIDESMAAWDVQPLKTHIFTSFAPTYSSRKVREALYRQQHAPGLLASVRQYSNHHWLYVSVV